jgi:hypothetical protein
MIHVREIDHQGPSIYVRDPEYNVVGLKGPPLSKEHR